MDNNREELIELFSDCIKKRRIISDINNEAVSQLQEIEHSFNTKTVLYKPKLMYRYMELGILPVETRPDFLLFYNTGESSVIEVVSDQNQLKFLFSKKYTDQDEYFYKYFGDYRYILCSNNINTEAIPDNWGILKIDMVEKKKYPHIIFKQPAKWVKKNYYLECELLIKKLCILNERLQNIHRISAI